MPLIDGIFHPIDAHTAARMYVQAMQTIRGQLGRQAQGYAPLDEREIMQRIMARNPTAGTYQPADRGRILQVIRSAQSTHDRGTSLNDPRMQAGSVRTLNVDPSIEDGGSLVRYRVTVRAAFTDGTVSETNVLVDSDSLLSLEEVRERALQAARQYISNQFRAADYPDWQRPGVQFTFYITSVGRRR